MHCMDSTIYKEMKPVIWRRSVHVLLAQLRLALVARSLESNA